MASGDAHVETKCKIPIRQVSLYRIFIYQYSRRFSVRRIFTLLNGIGYNNLNICRIETISDEFMNFIKPLWAAEEDLIKLRNHEILEVICRLCKWLYVNTERPSAAILHSECLIYNFIRLCQDDFSKTYMNEESRRYVKKTLQAIGNFVLLSLKRVL